MKGRWNGYGRGVSAKKRGRYATAITEARDLLRWRSPLRTELWAGRLTAQLQPDEVAPFLDRLAADPSPEAHLTLAALKAVDTGTPAADTDWIARMGQVTCDGAWYGKADPHGEQALAVLSFRYDNGKEPHLLVVGIDQANGGYAVDAVVEEPRFLDDLGLAEAAPALVAGRILDAFELTDTVLGAPVAETLPAERTFALARTRTIPDPQRHAPDDTVTRFDGLPDLPGAEEAFARLVEFVGDRPLWWSPSRVSAFLTQWLPREAIMSEGAVEAMPEVVRAWTAHLGDLPDVQQAIEEVAPWLAALMSNESLAGLRKRIAMGED